MKIKTFMYGCVIVSLVLLFVAIGFSGGKNSNQSSSNKDYGGHSTKQHSCYVCGKTGNLKYGSHYYCSTHWAMVKTVTEAGQ